MECQRMFSGKSKTNIANLSSVELAQRVVKVNGLFTYTSPPLNTKLKITDYCFKPSTSCLVKFCKNQSSNRVVRWQAVTRTHKYS